MSVLEHLFKLLDWCKCLMGIRGDQRLTTRDSETMYETLFMVLVFSKPGLTFEYPN